MSDKPTYSVIIPTYNRASLTLRAVESVLGQGVQDFEVIVVDDASNDFGKLEENISRLDDDRLRLIRHSSRKHGGGARNTGIDAAQGKYICFLDSDDRWSADKLEIYGKELINQNDILYGSLEKFGNQVGRFPSRPKKLDEKVSDYLFCHDGCMQTSTLVMTNKFAKTVRFDPGLVRFQDFDFVIRAEKLGGNFKFVEPVTSFQYDCDQGNRISNSYDHAVAENWINTIKGNVTNKAYRSFYLKRVCHYAVMSGNTMEALRILRTNPISIFAEPQLWFKYLLVTVLPKSYRDKLRKFLKKRQKSLG